MEDNKQVVDATISCECNSRMAKPTSLFEK